MTPTSRNSHDSAERAERNQELYFLGARLVSQGKYAEAADVLQESAILSPHYKTFELLGESFVHLNRHSEAIPPLAAALLLSTQPRAAALLADVFLTLGHYDRARTMANIAIERNPSYSWPREILQQIDRAEKTGSDPYIAPK